MSDMVICGLFEMEVVRKGIMKEGHCSSCFYNGSIIQDRELIAICEKDAETKLMAEPI